MLNFLTFITQEFDYLIVKLWLKNQRLYLTPFLPDNR